MVRSYGVGGGPCDFGVTPVPIGLGFGFWTALDLGLGLRGPDLGLGLDNWGGTLIFREVFKKKEEKKFGQGEGQQKVFDLIFYP